MALQTGVIAGAALDVFAEEPTDPALWHDLENVLLTPHLAGYAQEADVDMITELLNNLERYLRGAALLTPVER